MAKKSSLYLKIEEAASELFEGVHPAIADNSHVADTSQNRIYSHGYSSHLSKILLILKNFLPNCHIRQLLI